MINVTKTFLPPIIEYEKYLKKIWEKGWVTNDGPLVKKLEEKLKKFFDVENLFLVSNGTMALQIAIRSLNLKGEIITTPFSYIATSSSIIWENCNPVFVDINKETLTMDISKIEAKITTKTSAILATHVYGIPCDVENIKKIASKNKLKVIYDAAHAFGVKYNDKSIMNFGDISIISFHATKLFHTIEGGAIVANNKKLAQKISYMRNFGHKGPDKDFWGVGINAKLSEFHAAMGLCLFLKINNLISARKRHSALYDKLLDWNILLKPMRSYKNIKYNYSYYPIIFPSEKILLKVLKSLNESQIFPRRYFYPSLNTVKYIQKIKKQFMPVSEDISKRIMCLPLFYDLSKKDVINISEIIIKNLCD